MLLYKAELLTQNSIQPPAPSNELPVILGN